MPDGLNIVSLTAGAYRLRHILRAASQPDECLAFPDDLSFGPIAGDLLAIRPDVRTEWRGHEGKADRLDTFWHTLATDKRPLIIWFGRHSAEDLAMVMALCSELGDRDISVIDVTDLSIEAHWNGVSPSIPRPRSLHDVPNKALRYLASQHRPLALPERQALVSRWRALQAENAPSRIVSADGLVSSTGEVFDESLLKAVSHEWRRTAWVIGAAEDFASGTFRQTGTPGLLTRAEALVRQGVLEAQGNVWQLWDDDDEEEDCGLRLPASSPRAGPAQDGTYLHVASNYSFGGSLAGALRKANRNEDVARSPDELNAGPIATGSISERVEWQESVRYWPEFADALSAFWDEVSRGLPLAVWFGRGSAADLCLYLALCEILPERIGAIGDVSTLSVRCTGTDGCAIDLPPPRHLNEVPDIVLPLLTPHVVPPNPDEIKACAGLWRQLKAENAPFRVVGENGLTSQPETYFDDVILAAAGPEWRKTARVIGQALSESWRVYHQAGDAPLLARLVALAESGELDAQGDPWLMRESEVRLAKKQRKP